VIKVIKYNGQPYIEIDDLWQALHSTFNTAQYHIVNEEVLNKLESFANSSWNLFLEEEFTSALTKCNNSSVIIHLHQAPINWYGNILSIFSRT